VLKWLARIISVGWLHAAGILRRGDANHAHSIRTRLLRTTQDERPKTHQNRALHRHTSDGPTIRIRWKHNNLPLYRPARKNPIRGWGRQCRLPVVWCSVFHLLGYCVCSSCAPRHTHGAEGCPRTWADPRPLIPRCYTMPYLYLLIAICTETIATSALKTSESFTKLLPSLIVVAGYATSFYLLSLCLKTMKVGFVYAVWSGLGIVLISLAGILFFKQRIDLPGIIGMALIVAGVVVLNAFSNIQAH